uniref:Uncharacterized protein n=1 Tax=Clastoptera arizonana TaxID=38151 RepID=A0A1B6CP58_9HEMI
MFCLRRLSMIQSPLANISFANKTQSNQLWHWLTIIFNRVSQSRINEIGPDRACAEWLMRNGALIRWKGDTNFLTSYDNLPKDDEATGKKFHLQEVDATDSSIAHHGFAHFKNCKYIECIKFDNCLYLEDQGLKDLEAVKSSLESLIIWRCPNITDDGLLSLTSLL